MRVLSAMSASSKLLRAAGFLIPCIRYPTVARGSARLRITVNASCIPQRKSTLWAFA
jgi:8-amino-7-oxononanoate synthase